MRQHLDLQLTADPGRTAVVAAAVVCRRARSADVSAGQRTRPEVGHSHLHTKYQVFALRSWFSRSEVTYCLKQRAVSRAPNGPSVGSAMNINTLSGKPHHIVFDAARVVIRFGSGRQAQVQDVRVGEEVDSWGRNGATIGGVAHDGSKPEQRARNKPGVLMICRALHLGEYLRRHPNVTLVLLAKGKGRKKLPTT